MTAPQIPRVKTPRVLRKARLSKNVAMVNVGTKKVMKPGYWSKKPGQKAVFISSPARQPRRKDPVRLKTP